MTNQSFPSTPDLQGVVTTETYSSTSATMKRPLMQEAEESPFSKRQRVMGASSSSLLNDEVCRRVPCKARGLSNSHNADTAFFDIPLRAPHGFLLSCSHPECIDSGRRFRYCKVCALPVAKRNFLKRHGHGLIQSNQELKKEVDNPASCQFIFQADDGDSEASHNSMLCMPTLDNNNNNVTTAAPLLPQGMVKPGHRRVVSLDGSKQLPQPVALCSDASASCCSDESLPTLSSDTDHDESLSCEEKEWLSSLCKEPDANDPSCMGTWMNNMTEWMDKIAQSTVSSDTTPPPTVSPLGTPNPLLHPGAPLSNSMLPVPVSPSLQPTPEPAPSQPAPSQPAVPLAAPGRLITEGEFMEAIAGVDFSKVFD